MRTNGLLLSGIFGFALFCLLSPTGAAATEFAAGGYPATITGNGEGARTISFDEGKVSLSCSSASLSGEISSATGEISLAPSYSECTLGGLSVTVGANGCTYKIHSGTEVSENKLKGTLDLVCPAEKTLVIKASLVECEVQIGAQNGLGSIEYEDQPEPEPAKVLMSLALGGIKYSKTKDAGILCPLNGIGSKTDGKASGKANLIAKSGGETVAFQDGTISITVPAEVKLANVKEEKKFSISNS